MWLSLAIVLIIFGILGALFFALQGFFGRFPDNWEWVGIVLAGVGIGIGVQPFIQFIWGRPKIEIEFRARDSETSRFLDIYLYNRPVKSRFLKSIKVHRSQAEDVFVECNIENTQTHKVYADTLIPEIATTHQEEYSVSLPASTTPASILLIGAFDNGEVIINKNNTVLIPGKYCLTVTVHCAEIEVQERAYFSVGTKPYELCWDTINSS